MKSLQLRFFVVVWLFVVAALVALAALLGRWSLIELNRVSVEARVDRRIDALSQSLERAVLATSSGDSLVLSALLSNQTSRDTTLLGAALLDANGKVLGSSIPGLERESFVLGQDGTITFRQSLSGPEGIRRVMLAMPARRFERGGELNALVVVPALRTSTMSRRGSGPSPSDDLSRRIVIAVLVGSLLSALVTALIARPLLGRVGELSRATAALREGRFESRVSVRGNDEVAELGHAFNALAEELGASEAQRKQMVTDVAHELRTPLTNIIGLVEAVRDGLRAPDDALMLALQEEAGLLNRLVDDLRDLSLADAGELPLHLEPLSAPGELQRAAAGFPVAPGEARLTVEGGAPELAVLADRRRLGQMLRNLIQNARRHSPEGATVTLRAEPRGEMIRFLVIDEGEGISAEHLPHLFERFYRVDPSRDKATGGMGLGLALVLRLAEAQGGAAGVESLVGRGSTFWVELPVAQR